MSFSAGFAPDQYHALTTRLTANGYQSVTMRMVAACILVLAVPALLAGFDPPSTPWPGFRLAYTLIAVACLGLAVPWLGYRWPTRRQSATVVVLGTVALAGGCLATIQPASGMVIASAFSFILGYTALFHSSRLLAFTVAVAGVTVAFLVERIATGIAVTTAIALAVPVLLLLVVVTFACRTVARVVGSGETRYDLDPLTGLLTRSAFYECTSSLLGARHREEDRNLVVAVIDIDGFSAISGVHGGRGADQTEVAASQALRETTRREAVVSRVGTGEFLVADILTVSDPAPLIERIRDAIAAIPSRVTTSIGVVSTPLNPLIDRPPHDVLDDVIALASTAMARARAGGGNQARYLLDPDLGSG